jgi:predicted nucleotidyltransferase
MEIETATETSQSARAPPSTRDQVVAALKAAREQIIAFHVAKLFLYGSAARDEMTEISDVDVFIDYSPDSRFSLFDQIELQEYLAGLLQRDVDLTTRGGLHPLLKERIERSSIRVL